MAGKKSGEHINVAVRTNIARSVNVGSPASQRSTTSSQKVRIRQTDGRTEHLEVTEKKEASS